MDAISLAGAYQGIKAAKEILSGLFEQKVDSEARPKILEAQAKLGDVQDALFVLREKLSELQQERDELRSQLVDIQAWKAREQQYSLSSTVGGAVVYQFIGSPDHFACPSCFNRREVHILQDNHNMSGTFRCPGCQENFPVKQSRKIPSGRTIGM
ncbi:hypothetical protein [Rubrivivax albus]|uniref:Uncharacterized protein n=1 Tax=Rubrivivax albus TaxID=2499835 RepID=A0A437JL65_9BURK|nr:hypothetical protein [Rubrivivax albus]RVT47436.1 hypothetical protein ENE75_24195 [Rubrivivax albus]